MTVPEHAIHSILGGASPDTVAIETEMRVYTYRDLQNSVALRCEQLAISGARVVALLETDPVEWLIWDLAILQAGLICVPIPPFFTLGQVQHVLNQAGADTWIGPVFESLSLEGLNFAAGLCGWQRRVIPVAMPTGTSKVTFTSGTTGAPKGVCLSAVAMLQVAAALRDAMAGHQIGRHLTLLPLAVLLENLGVWSAFMSGATVCVRDIKPFSVNAEDQQNLLASIVRTQANSMILVPQLLAGLLQATDRGFVLPDSIRFIAVGGGRVAQGLLDQVSRLEWPVYEGYGLSECASVVCLNRPEAHRPGTVGKALPHLQVMLADDGEIMVLGAGVLGYLDNPHDPDQPWPTGDIGTITDGYLTISGRKKHQFITAFGRNVNPEWVEAELCSQQEISQAFVYGEALPLNAAVIVSDQSDQAVQSAIDLANTSLPDYAQVSIWMRARAPFSTQNRQLTANGRLRREQILDCYQSFFQPSKLNLECTSCFTSN
ncbi:MAG: AMP-binding protein [Pseudomonadota bacterium]|nr:AMP-binding protein [Pseudomonadota bacterium]